MSPGTVDFGRATGSTVRTQAVTIGNLRFRHPDWGISEATVWIFFDGVLAGEVSRRMRSTGEFWEAADIVWTADERRVVPLGP